MALRWSEEQLTAYLKRDQPPVLLEATFQAAVMQLARQYGWMCWHAYSARKSVPGWPDLAMAHPAGGRPLICAELKREDGQVTPAQQAWLDALAGCTGVVAEVWRPADLERIVQRLRC